MKTERTAKLTDEGFRQMGSNFPYVLILLRKETVNMALGMLKRRNILYFTTDSQEKRGLYIVEKERFPATEFINNKIGYQIIN